MISFKKSKGSSGRSERRQNRPKDGSSNLSPWTIKPFQIRWNEPLGRPECPYMCRTVLIVYDYAARLHRWFRSDDKRFFHDHSWWYINIVLWGSLVDVTPTGRRLRKTGSIGFYPATHQHYVEIPVGGAITFLISGRPIRNWGYWVNGKLKRPLKYFHRYGHPPCGEQ